MSPFSTRGAADELARLLDAGRTTGAPGVALAARLSTVGAALDGVVAPRPEFRDALRMRLVAVATVSASAPAAAPRALPVVAAWRRRGAAVAAGAMASVVAVSGVAVAGSQSLPGDPFYGVKRTTEAFQLQTADGDLEKGTRHLDFAAARLREVRGLTLGRDAADAGPALGPSATSAGITLRSAAQPLASGDALSAGAAALVQETLAEMDAQTRDGSALLTGAYRSSRTPQPLQVLARFTSRQSAGLEQLMPALPPATQDRARLSLALLTGVAETTDELLSAGSCGSACDPSQAAPGLPAAPGTTTSETPCECAAPAPAPAPEPTTSATSASEPRTTPEPQPAPTREAPAAPSSPQPAPNPTRSGLPVPAPSLPAPLPSLPVPAPTLTLPPLAPAQPPAPAVEQQLPGAVGKARAADRKPAPAPRPAPVPPGD